VYSTNQLIVHGEARLASPIPGWQASLVIGPPGTITPAPSSVGGRSVPGHAGLICSQRCKYELDE